MLVCCMGAVLEAPPSPKPARPRVTSPEYGEPLPQEAGHVQMTVCMQGTADISECTCHTD